MKKYIFAAFVSVLSVTYFSSYSFGFDAVKKLLAVGHCPKCNLTSEDPTEAKLRGANLKKAIMWETKLVNADLTGARMRDANINGAIFCRTKTPWGLDNSGCE